MSNKELVIITASEDDASKVYVNKKIEKCNEHNIPCNNVNVTDRRWTKQEDDLYNVKELLKDMAESENVGGILLQLPLAPHLQQYEREFLDMIPPEKDVDCLTTINQGKIMMGDNSLLPCTTQAVMDDIKAHCFKGDLRGQKVHVVGRSILVTKPLITALINEGASVTNWNSVFNKDDILDSVEKDCDCFNRVHFVTGIGVPEHFNFEEIPEYLNGVYIYDIGMNRDKDGKLCGDVKRACNNVEYQTPVPGGIGPKTVENVINNFKKLNKE